MNYTGNNESFDTEVLWLLWAYLFGDTWSKFHLPWARDIVNSWSGRSWIWGSCCTPDRCEGSKISPMADNWNFHCAWIKIIVMFFFFNVQPWAKKSESISEYSSPSTTLVALPLSFSNPTLAMLFHPSEHGQELLLFPFPDPKVKRRFPGGSQGGGTEKNSPWEEQVSYEPEGWPATKTTSLLKETKTLRWESQL